MGVMYNSLAEKNSQVMHSIKLQKKLKKRLIIDSNFVDLQPRPGKGIPSGQRVKKECIIRQLQ